MTIGKTGTRQACLQELIQEGKVVIGCSNLFDPEVCYQRIVLLEACSYMSSLGLRSMDAKKKEMEHKRKDADASLRQRHLGVPLWTAPRSLTRRCGSVQGGPGEPEDAPQGKRASRNEMAMPRCTKGFLVSRIEKHPIAAVTARLWDRSKDLYYQILVSVHLLEAKSLILSPPRHFAI
jgi:hypothetical protein